MYRSNYYARVYNVFWQAGKTQQVQEVQLPTSIAVFVFVWTVIENEVRPAEILLAIEPKIVDF
jgi:hypothetical protein